jgi:hypothetical protein
VNITITTRGGDTVAIDLSSLLADAASVAGIPTVAPALVIPAIDVTALDAAPVEIPAPAAPAKRAPRKSKATAPAAPATADAPAKRDSASNKALFRQISALKRARKFDEATALAAAAGWTGEVDSIARKRAALAAA